MKTITQPNRGKIMLHSEGHGETTAREIDQRAAEIATTEGRTTPNQEDRARARAELRGATLPVRGPDDVVGENSLSRDPSDPPAQRGHQTPSRDGPDEKKALERLVSEGVEEAQHDQMVAASRKRER